MRVARAMMAVCIETIDNNQSPGLCFYTTSWSESWSTLGRRSAKMEHVWLFKVLLLVSFVSNGETDNKQHGCTQVFKKGEDAQVA